jgi:hypothetical protein
MKPCELHMGRWLFVILLLLAGTISAQNPPQTPSTKSQPQQGSGHAAASVEGASDSNPLGVVLLQFRNEYYNLNDGNWTNALIIRSDRVFLKKNNLGGKLGILTRFDLPIVAADIGSSTHAGLGDLYGQFTYVLYLTPKFGLFLGSGASEPSATYKTLGTGKWTIDRLRWTGILCRSPRQTRLYQVPGLHLRRGKL